MDRYIDRLQGLQQSSTVVLAAWLERPQRKRRDMEQTVGRKRPPLEPFAFAEKMPTSKGTQHREDIFQESTVSLLTAEACNPATTNTTTVFLVALCLVDV